MSNVSVPIEANPTSAVSAINAIRQATRDATKDNRELAAELEKVNKQFDQLQKVNSGLKARVKATGQSGVPFADMDWERLYDDPRTAARARSQSTRYVAQGTPWEIGEDAAFPPGHDRQSDGAGSSLAGGAMAMAARTLPLLATIAGIGGTVSYLRGGENTAESQAMAVDELQRSLGGTKESFDQFGHQIRGIGRDIGMMSSEAIALAKEFSALSGITETERLRKSAGEAAAFGRAMGMAPGTGAGLLARGQWLMGDRSSQREFATILAEAISGSGMWSKGDEVASSILRFVESSERFMVNPPNAAAYAELKANMDASGLPGMRGQMAESLIMQMDQAVRRPSNEHFEAFMARALNPDGKTLGVYDMMRLRETGGLFGSRKSVLGKGDDTTNLDNILARSKTAFRDPDGRAFALSRGLGVPVEKVDAFIDLYENKGIRFGGIAEQAKIIGRSPENIPSAALPEMAALAKIKNEEIGDYRANYMAAHPEMPRSARTLLERAEDPAEIRKQLLLTMVSPEMGLSASHGLDVMRSRSDSERAQTDFGERLTGPFTAIRDAGTSFSEGAARFTDAVDRLIQHMQGKEYYDPTGRTAQPRPQPQ